MNIKIIIGVVLLIAGTISVVASFAVSETPISLSCPECPNFTIPECPNCSLVYSAPNISLSCPELNTSKLNFSCPLCNPIINMNITENCRQTNLNLNLTFNNSSTIMTFAGMGKYIANVNGTVFEVKIP